MARRRRLYNQLTNQIQTTQSKTTITLRTHQYHPNESNQSARNHLRCPIPRRSCRKPTTHFTPRQHTRAHHTHNPTTTQNHQSPMDRRSSQLPNQIHELLLHPTRRCTRSLLRTHTSRMVSYTNQHHNLDNTRNHRNSIHIQTLRTSPKQHKPINLFKA